MLVALSALRRATEIALDLGCSPADIDQVWAQIPETTTSATARVQMSVFGEVLNQLAELSHCEHFGLLVGSGYRPSDLGAFGYMLVNCPTIGDVLRRGLKYIDFHQQGVISNLIVGRDGTILISYAASGLDRSHARHDAESAIASIFAIISQLAGPSASPREVTFRHGAPSDIRPYQQVFACPVEFNQPLNAIRFRKTLLDFPLSRADPGLLVLLEENISNDLRRLPRNSDLIGQVRWAILQALPAGQATLQSVSAICGLSARSMQRSLARSGKSFEEIRDEVRKDLHREMTARGRMSAKEIAESIAFSDASAMAKALRRWNARPPAEAN